MAHYLKIALAPALIGLMLAASCNTAEPEQRDRITLAESSLSQGEAMSQFASILSQAAANNEDLRSFIRNQALEMFDNDYDVFYPFVKDMTVSGSKTFAQILSEYCTSETQLEEIEAAVPKLTILVPDWEWLGAFSVNNWDTADPEVLVGFAESGETRTLYKDGEANSIGDWEFPLSPTLIIKSNERMVASGVTKSGERMFAFKYPEFDKRNNPQELQTRGRAWHHDEIELPVTEFIGNFVPASDIDPLVIGAYNEFKDGSIPNACQRDYIYYGMGKSNRDNGVLNNGIRERLYRFRFEPQAYESMSNENDNDPKLSGRIEKKGKKNQLSKEELMKRMWSGGAFEIKFDFYIGHSSVDGEKISPTESFKFTCNPEDLFDLTKVQRNYKCQTVTAQGVYQYDFKSEDLATKWFYPAEIQTLPVTWDLSQESNEIKIMAWEVDDSAETTTTESWSYSQSTNFNAGLDKNIKIGFGVNNSKQHNVSIAITKKEGSDEIGTKGLEYVRRIINKPDSQVINGTTVQGYDVEPLPFGDLIVTIVPVNIR